MASLELETAWDNSSNSNTSNVTSPPKYPCPSCHRTFKRLEHLRRHQRSHDGRKSFVCGMCSKGFARSDILHRHESTHAVAVQPIIFPGNRRACLECARMKAGCNRGEPCMRCSSRALRCSYPQETSDGGFNGNERGSQRNEMVQTAISSFSNATQTRGGGAELGRMEDSLMATIPNHTPATGGFDTGDNQSGFQAHHSPGEPAPFSSDHAASETPSAISVNPTFQQSNMVQSEYAQRDFLDANAGGHMGSLDRGFNQLMDFPMNWLPVNESITIDYNSIHGFGVSSLGLFPALLEDMVEDSPFDNQTRTLSSSATNTHSQIEETRIADCLPENPAPPMQQLSPLNHQNKPAASASAGSPAGTVSSGSQNSIDPIAWRSMRGSLYTTSSNGARIPCTVRRKRPHLLIHGATPLGLISNNRYKIYDEQEILEFPDLRHMHVGHGDEDLGSKAISSATYEIMKEHFARLCFEGNGFFSSYGSTNFPPLHHLNLFGRLYYENFDPILPILHDQVTAPNDYWPLALAACAIGCQYTEMDDFSKCVEPLQEFLRRVIATETESVSRNEFGIALAQAMILSQIGMRYFGSKRLSSRARAGHSTLIEMAHSSVFLKPSQFLENGHLYHSSGSQEAAMKTMLMEEAKRRLGYTIWLLDCMAVYHFNKQPLLSLEITQYPLPQEQLWSVKTYGEWLALPKLNDAGPSLSEAVQVIFRDNKIDPDMGEFSRMLLLHGVYQEIIQVNSCLTRPLATWIPSVRQTNSSDSGAKSPPIQDIGVRSLISNWRNAALDSVDVLHWAAMATIASLAGAEHPSVLHLHFARVVLLVPFEKLRTLASSIASVAQDPRLRGMGVPKRHEIMDAEREVLEWAQRDEHKARLAVLHCGCLYWHIRRYSCRAFYEPISVFLATLTIWAYSSYGSRMPLSNQHMNLNNTDYCRSGSVTRQPSPEASSNSPTGDSNIAASAVLDDEPEPTFIRLDRPNDDEMVQLYVRSGRPSTMRAYITGVGDIYSPRGPIKVLREGRKILNAVSSAWGRTQEYIAILEALEKVSSDNIGPDRA